jgi:phosphoribosylformylglycinamidine cyclo-ligase
VKSILALLKTLPVKGMAHITGGGLVENVPRMLPDRLQARIDRSRWTRPAVFDWLQSHGNVQDGEMHRVLNCGIGMVACVAPGDAERAIAMLRASGEDAQPIGTIVPRAAGAPGALVV